MNEAQIFNHERFGEIRTIDIDSKLFFVGNDIAKALGYVKSRNALNQHCKGCLKIGLPSNSGIQETIVIPEGDIYRLIARSKLPEAEQFESWVFDEVLPSIRQNGGYIKNQNEMTQMELMANAVLFANTFMENQKKQLEAQKILLSEQIPKVEAYKQFMDSQDGMKMHEAAKLLKIPDFGRNNLFNFLRTEGILMSDNTPYQEYINRGYFKVIAKTYTDKRTQATHISKTTLVLSKGLDYIRNIINKKILTN